MLRITATERPRVLSFRLEGRLDGPWARELEKCWRGMVARSGTPALRVDLTGVKLASFLLYTIDRRPFEERLATVTASLAQAGAELARAPRSTELDDLLESEVRSRPIAPALLHPLLSSGKSRRRVEVAECRQRQTLHSYERPVLLAFLEMEDALAGLRQAGLRRTSEGERVAAERKMLQLAELRYRGGVAYLGVLDAQRSLLSAGLDETAAVRDELVALVKLYQTLGDGWTEPDQPEQAPRDSVVQGWRPPRSR